MKAKKKDTEKRFTYGPFRLTQKGTHVLLETKWKKDEYQEFIKNLQTLKPELRQSIGEIIERLENLMITCNPLKIIVNFSKLGMIRIPGSNIASGEEQSEAFLEYLMSLALSNPFPEASMDPIDEVISEIRTLWNDLINKVVTYFGIEMVEQTNSKPEANLRFHLIISYLLKRGDAYLLHLDRTFLELFKSHDQFLKRVLGFSSQDLYEFMEYIATRMEAAIRDEIQALKSIRDTFIQFNEDIRRGRSPITPQKLSQKDKKVLDPFYAFEIQPRNNLDRVILDSLSCEFGMNDNFLTKSKEMRGWPSNDSIISTNPIIIYDNKYYLFHIHLALRNCKFILEHHLKRVAPDYYQKKYLPSKGDYLENSAITMVSGLLPECKLFKRLFYDIDEDNQIKRCELDGLVMYDDCLILIEAKARKISISSKRGSIKKIKTDMKRILADGHKQATRALNFINSSKTVTFTDNRGKPILNIETDRFQHKFIILVSMEPLHELSTHLSTARRLGLLPGTEWPWFVYLNDLRVISEINNHPTTFLHYLMKRIMLNDSPKVSSIDELDYFMMYANSGLSPSQKEMKQLDNYLVGPHTQDLDIYYNSLYDNDVKISKPKIRMNKDFEDLISYLENKRSVHFSTICLNLLDYDDENKNKIVESIQDCEKRRIASSKRTGNVLDFGKSGVLLLCLERIEDQAIERYAERRFEKMNMEKLNVICWTPPLGTGKIKTFCLSEKH